MSDIVRKLTIFGCLLITGFCFWKAASGLIGGADASVVSTAEAAMSPSYAHKRGITTPIQDMRPGMRIVGRNPNRLETESVIDPTPEGWRLLSVRMLKQDGSYFEAELLRSLSWIHRHQARPGATIQLNMPELRVVGAAEVLSISDCPPIDPGDGPVVVSTFKNIANNVLNIYVEGEETPIGVTAGHPIWSEDRQAFVHSEKLQIGERLRSALGHTVRITSIEPRAGPEAVYNLEVAGEHVYSITDSGLLVHNIGCEDLSTTIDVFSSSRLVSQTDTVNPLGGTPLTPQSLIIDSNVAIALEKQAAGTSLQPGEKVLLNRLSSLGATDLRIANVSALEFRNANSFGRITVDTTNPSYTSLLQTLKNARVGRKKGVLDRQIVAEAFFAEGSQATLLTLDRGVFNPLASLAGHDVSKLGKSVPQSFPNGFSVTINGRSIRVIPVEQ